ncbi:hypothetical protein ACFE04_027924 [Oxalis oulophora]
MKRGRSSSKLGKLDMFVSLPRQRSVQILIALGISYILLVTLEIPFVFKNGFTSIQQGPITRPSSLAATHQIFETPTRPSTWVDSAQFTSAATVKNIISNLSFNISDFDPTTKDGSIELHKSAKTAWWDGRKLWQDLESGKLIPNVEKKIENRSESCPHSISLTGLEFTQRGKLMVLPCGLTLGSHIIVVGKPRKMQAEKEPEIDLTKDDEVSTVILQFMMELQGLQTVEGEEPPKILHFNPRLKGDWRGKPVIEQNTCYRQAWGMAIRCEGWKSKADEETVDGQVKCEKWIRDDDDHSEESKSIWWLNRLIGRTKKVVVNWPFPFAEEKLFVLMLSAGLEGYHVSVDGRHITSFPYRTGFTLEDATGLTLDGDIYIHSIFAAALPMSHPSFASQRHLELSSKWKAPRLSEQPVEMFIGILSAGNHFAERMALRKSWLQNDLIKSSYVVARFFVALNARKEVNVELKKEAEFFGDIVIVPYMDNYDLVVLKTVAICEHGARAMSARYIMKCDDDTFVKVDVVVNEVRKVPQDKSLYIGNINYNHKPLRWGKWAVTYEEWPEDDYPAYANGPGYIMSADIALFVTSELKSKRQIINSAVVQDGRRKYGNVGRTIQQHEKAREVPTQHEVLSVRMHRRILHGTLPIAETDDLSMG